MLVSSCLAVPSRSLSRIIFFSLLLLSSSSQLISSLLLASLLLLTSLYIRLLLCTSLLFSVLFFFSIIYFLESLTFSFDRVVAKIAKIEADAGINLPAGDDDISKVHVTGIDR